MLHTVKNYEQANNSTLPVTHSPATQGDNLFSFLENLQPKWVRMCFKRGQYQIQLSLGNGNDKYHYATGLTEQELLENLKARLLSYGVAC